MTLIELVSREAGSRRRRLIASALFAGIANVLILVTLNLLVHFAEYREVRTLFLLLLFIAIYACCAHHTTSQTIGLIECALARVKLRVGEQIAQAELAALERVRAAEICDRLSENTALITDRAGAFATMMQSLVILAFAAAYIAWISVPAFALLTLLGVAGTLLLHTLRKDIVTAMAQSGKSRIVFLERLTDLLQGFKEAQFSRRRRRELRDDIVEASDSLRAIAVRFSDFLSSGMILGEVVLFALLAAIVYTLHAHVPVGAWTLTHLIAAVMFIWAPFMTVATGIMPYMRSNLALDQIAALEDKLAGAVHQVQGHAAPAEDPWQGRPGLIEARELAYTYSAEAGGEQFTIGPLDLQLVPGELVFIVGGNGSGKSTLLKVLTGLYPPSCGTLSASGILIGPQNLDAFRNMISAIFADFHLFAKLYGLAEMPASTVQHLLTRMQLQDKLSYADRTFSRLNLSTGQKKRLAMIVALLEDRPICVFDEWAADQDPEFRRYFYEELLPLLRRQGKTVVVVSHDDRYFHCADRVVTMEDGKIRSVAAAAVPA